MRISYDQESNVMRVTTDAKASTAASLVDDPGIALELATPEGHDIVGLIVMGASAYVRLDMGYIEETDTLLMGSPVEDPALITENGDFVGYWQVNEADPDGFWDPVGVAIRQASKHFADFADFTK